MIKFLKRKNLIKAHGHTDCNKHNCDGILVKAWCSCDAWQVSEADKYRDTHGRLRFDTGRNVRDWGKVRNST